jgi:tetratricopeptide (TPR) repeat protein
MIRTLLILILLAVSSALGGCTPTALNYEGSGWTGEPAQADARNAESTDQTPDRAAAHSAVPPEPVEEELDWSDLTRMAREDQRRREYERAEQRLDQAALLVSGLPPTNASRRAVFGIRSRFAEQLGKLEEVERADALADQLLAEAEAEPELGGAAFVSLALSLADRRARSATEAAGAAEEAGDTESAERIESPSELELLQIALTTAQTSTASRQRFGLATRVAEDAYNQDRLDLARNAIDQALADISILSPSSRQQVTRLLLQRARIATADGDFEVAIADATRSNQLMEELDAGPSIRGYGEATLAEALAKSGETDRAIAIARGARARLDGEVAVDAATRRAILASLARVEFAMGDLDRARRTYDEALEVPGDESDRDRHLIGQLMAERSALIEPGSE